MFCIAIVGGAFGGTALAAEPVAGHLDCSIASNAQFTDYTSSGQRLQYVILPSWDADRMRALKAANPHLEVLVYKNLLASQTPAEDGLSATGVTYEEALTHPEWFLLNTSGQPFTLRDYSYQWAMDVGNQGYQQRWAENVLADVKAQGWDGVFIDNVDPTLEYYAEVSSIAKYPTDAEYAAATQSALATITPRLRAAHMLVFANFGSWSDYDTTVTPWLKYVDGAMEEMFAKFDPTAGAGYLDEAEWTRQLDELKETQRQGKVFLAVTHSATDDQAAALYGWATVLLGAEGKADYEMAETYADETWFPEYEYDIGPPLGAESRDTNGVHRRAFTNGLVLVNPTAGPETISLGGVYSGSGLTRATSATMPSHTALVLLRDSSHTGAPAQSSTPAVQPANQLRPGDYGQSARPSASRRSAKAPSSAHIRLRNATRPLTCMRKPGVGVSAGSSARSHTERRATARCRQRTRQRHLSRSHGSSH